MRVLLVCQGLYGGLKGFVSFNIGKASLPCPEDTCAE